MRKLTRKQILACLFMGFFAIGSMLSSCNSAAIAETYGNYSINGGEVLPLTDEEIKPENPSDNTVKINICGPDTSAKLKNFYGGYIEGENKNSLHNTVSVKGSEENVSMLPDVYGGFVKGTGKANENTLNLSFCNDEHYQGFISGGCTDNGEASLNTVSLSEGYYGYVAGGKINENGNSCKNKVICSNIGTEEIYGGIVGKNEPWEYMGNTGDVEDNEVILKDNIGSSGVFGGFTVNGNAINNKVTVIPGSNSSDEIINYLRSVCGGQANIGTAKENEVSIINNKETDLLVSQIFGGRAHNAIANRVNIEDSNIKEWRFFYNLWWQ